MNIEGEIHWEMLIVLPSAVLTSTQCECCDEPGPVVLSVGWLFWSIHFVFGEGGLHQP